MSLAGTGNMRYNGGMVEKRKKAGRPPKNDPDDIKSIQAKIDAYFDKCRDDEENPTWCGLALALGYATRQALWENANAGKPISIPIKIAMLRVEESYEKGLRSPAPVGCIFALKNRGWTDKPEDKEKDETISKLLAIAERLTSGHD